MTEMHDRVNFKYLKFSKHFTNLADLIFIKSKFSKLYRGTNMSYSVLPFQSVKVGRERESPQRITDYLFRCKQTRWINE